MVSKRSLARQRWKYTQNYADAKSTVVEEILARSSNPDEHDRGCAQADASSGCIPGHWRSRVVLRVAVCLWMF